VLELAVPQLRSTEEPFRPAVTDQLQTRTADLESLVRGMYVRGLSTQDVSALYTDTFGGSRLRKSTVSRVTQQLKSASPLRFPEADHRRIRTTNRLERLNGEGVAARRSFRDFRLNVRV
jgi:transposase-like protein